MMLKYLFGEDELVAAFVAAMIPRVRQRGFGRCKTIGIVDGDNELIAGLVYHHLDPEAGLIEISGAALPGRLWATRETLKLMHQVPFIQYGCQMVIMRVEAANERLLRQLMALGYELAPMPRLYGREQDGVICWLTDDAWAASKLCQRYGHHIPDNTKVEEAA
jgi:RimJ/RimL family protein N-acetyltransferase